MASMSTSDDAPAEDPAAPTRRFAEVAVDGVAVWSNGGILTYLVPDGLAPEPGQVVWVPLRSKMVHGIVTRLTDEVPEFSTRPIGGIADPPVGLTPEQCAIAAWMARETASTFFACASLFLPPGRAYRAIEMLSLNDDADMGDVELTTLQEKVVDLLLERGEMSLPQLKAATGQPLTSVVPELVSKGVLIREMRPDDKVPGMRMLRFLRVVDHDVAIPDRAPKQRAVMDELVHLYRAAQDRETDLVPLHDLQQVIGVDTAVLDALVDRGAIEIIELPAREAPQPRASVAPTMNASQAAAWVTLERRLASGDPTPNLLFGVTGSGKTEIYLRAVAWCLRHGKTAIILVPEIALATQVVRRFIDRFPGRVAVLHSQLTDGERYDIWRSVGTGEVSVIVGPRSVLFTPVRDPGVIVIDEEHDASFKQDSEPRYHARAVAQKIAETYGVPLVLGSATPSVESMWRAKEGMYHLLELPERVAPVRGSNLSQRLELPEVETVDLKDELRQGNSGMLSRSLKSAVQRSLSRGEQAILLLNRRGMSTIVMCRACAHRIECPNCDIPLVFHKDMHELVCHRCDYRMIPPDACPECGGRLDYFGAGTQRVEDEVRRQFPDARVMRWDQDAVRRSGGYAAMLQRVEDGHVDIIVGTQMVSKGFDLPGVTTIGVVQADSMLYLPDFRSPERTFQLLTQVAGRAGRRGPGSVVVFQTYTPDHYAVLAASKHDYRQFYADEIVFREQFRFPPFFRLARFVVRKDTERDAAFEAEMLARDLARFARANDIDMEMLGPTPAFVAKIRNQYQWQIVMRTKELDAMLDGLPIRPGWVVDIDPESML
jgi:primosomal protein N' (replication factor Y) (superfamily II helicase)